MTPDAYVQDPTLVQHLNRYSYVINNPLSYTDPSGHFFKHLGKQIKRAFKSANDAISNPGAFINSTFEKFGRAATDARYLRLAASMAISVVATVACPASVSAILYQSAAYYAAVGPTSSYVATNGDSKAALYCAMAGATFSGVGSAYEHAKNGGQLSNSMMAAKVAAHGVVGGFFSQVQGGSI